MLEIKFDVTTLSTEQRQDLASFILGFPGKVSEPLTSQIVYKQEFGRALRPAPTNVQVHDFSPESPPLPEGASAAPISAGAEASSTVPEVTQETILANPIVNIPPVPQSANAAGSAALPQTSPVELDSEGLPWDKRIHASTKTKIASGTWKLARGVDASVVEAVKAELRGLMSVPVTGSVIPKNGFSITERGIYFLSDGNVPKTLDQVINTPIVPVDIEVVHSTGHVDHTPESRIPAPPASHYLVAPIRHSFVDFIEDITKLLVSKKLAQPEIIKACNDAGVAAPNLLAARQDLIPQVAKALTDIVASRI